MSRVVVLIRMIYTYTIPVVGRMPRPQNKFHNTGKITFRATDFKLFRCFFFEKRKNLVVEKQYLFVTLSV